MRILFTLFALLLVYKTLADQPRHCYSFKSTNGYFELRPSDTIFSDNKVYRDSVYNSKTKKYFISSYRYADQYRWSLYDLRSNKRLYTLKSDDQLIAYKTARISEDGSHIIMVDDYSNGIGFPTFEIVHFYKEGELVRTLTLGDLLDNMCSISYSASHLFWCSEFNFLTAHSFQIKTYEFYSYQFDLNGNLMAKISDENIRPNDDIVVAKIRRLGKDNYSFIVEKSIRNKYEPETELIITVSDEVMRKIHGRFNGLSSSRNKKMETTFYQTVLFRDGQPIYSEFTFPNYNGDESCNQINNHFRKN